MAKIRFALRGVATVLMGKNTMMRKIISLYIKDNPGHPFEQASVRVIVGMFPVCKMGTRAISLWAPIFFFSIRKWYSRR